MKSYIDAAGPCACGNCNWKGDAKELEGISDLHGRISAGETVPAGECPKCGCLAYLDKPVELSACCHAPIYYDAWADSSGECTNTFDHHICSDCSEEKPHEWDGISPPTNPDSDAAQNAKQEADHGNA